MNFIFHPSAKKELEQAVAYYEKCQIGLGHEFLEEIYSTVQRILNFPNAWSTLSIHTRRCLTNRFPFGIIYQIQNDDCIRIISIMQLNKKPDYWHGRL
ncbi:type II toxin-antitoxin system RelE/ParE family toxin [bacterium]|nr:type II toxin-antitoxin system RelE/ParE family toxin [bacterium]